ncbi:MAG: nucleoside triphosphate pyrophosphohydrolase family protein [Anaerolineae bacterium]|nr:nucleoside triphosphate pyrophosphohydrolase family protein [Anaerolineae bacterium]
MKFSEYQIAARKTAIYPHRGRNLAYPALGLAGESGEVAEKVKKVIRDKNGVVDPETREALKKELGDVFWYVAALCDEVGLDMEDVAASNINKLLDRQERNVLHGSGDNR